MPVLLYIKGKFFHFSALFGSVFFHVSKIEARGWRNSSVVRNTHYTLRGPGFNSQHLHGSSGTPITPVPGI